MERYSFTRKERLKKNSSINDVFDNGIPFKGRFLKVFLLKRISGPTVNRVAFISRKSLYNRKIVLKNRFKRLLREAYRKTKHLLPHTYDIVILATNIKKGTRSFILEEDLENVFKKCIKK